MGNYAQILKFMIGKNSGNINLNGLPPFVFVLPAFLPPRTLPSWRIEKSFCVTLSMWGCPDAWLTWFYLLNITDPGRQWKKNIGPEPNPAWHISHQIWAWAESIVWTRSLCWLMSKPAVKLWPPRQGDSAFPPSLSVLLAALVFGPALIFLWPPASPPPLRTVCLSLFAPLCHAGQHIHTSNQSLSKQQTFSW